MSHFHAYESDADIYHRFAYHPPTSQEKKDDHVAVRAKLSQAAHFINAAVPNGREKDLAITKLKEAMFWANAAIARSKEETK